MLAARQSGEETTWLRLGELHLDGRLVESSNNALVGTVTVDGTSSRIVYKPTAGERPLWDFPDGTLAGREVAAYLVSEAADWHCVPTTVLRDGPFGIGMAQQWIDGADPDAAVDIFPADRVPDGWLPVFAAQDAAGEPVIVAHQDRAALATIAVFDAVCNNADRKGAHLLGAPDGRLLAVDHGLTFHVEDKLRTILWGWAGRPLPGSVIPGLERLSAALENSLGALLADYLTDTEIDALQDRVTALLADRRFPQPPAHRPAIPWPPL